MRKIISALLVLVLLGQPLAVPLSVLTISKVYASNQASNHLAQLATPRGSGMVKGTQAQIFSYDSSGNLLDDGERTITWDVEGKAIKVELRGTNYESRYIYDSSGARVAKVVKDEQGNIIKATLYIGGNLEKNLLTGEITKYYDAGASLTQRQGDNVVYIHKDHLSSSTFFTDSTGAKTNALLTYYPYGTNRTNWDEPNNSSTPGESLRATPGVDLAVATDRLYTGQIKDTETNLYYYHARYYNPKLGLFISADTAGGGNRYAYANNTPLIFSDPTGNQPYGPPFIPFGLRACYVNPGCRALIRQIAETIVVGAVSSVVGGSSPVYAPEEGMGTGYVAPGDLIPATEDPLSPCFGGDPACNLPQSDDTGDYLWDAVTSALSAGLARGLLGKAGRLAPRSSGPVRYRSYESAIDVPSPSRKLKIIVLDPTENIGEGLARHINRFYPEIATAEYIPDIKDAVARFVIQEEKADLFLIHSRAHDYKIPLGFPRDSVALANRLLERDSPIATIIYNHGLLQEQEVLREMLGITGGFPYTAEVEWGLDLTDKLPSYLLKLIELLD